MLDASLQYFCNVYIEFTIESIKKNESGKATVTVDEMEIKIEKNAQKIKMNIFFNVELKTNRKQLTSEIIIKIN